VPSRAPTSTPTLVLWATLACLWPAGGASAQAPLTLEARGGVFVPIAGFRSGPERGGRLRPAPTLGVAFALERSNGLHLHVGFSQHRLDCRDDGCAGDGTYVATSWDVGARQDLGSGAMVPWVRVGMTFPRVERDRPEPLASEVTGLGIGGEAGAGVRVAVAGRFHVSPALRFGAVDASMPSGGTLRMRYLVADVAVVLGF
jgi:hypothetical protein